MPKKKKKKSSKLPYVHIDMLHQEQDEFPDDAIGPKSQKDHGGEASKEPHSASQEYEAYPSEVVSATDSGLSKKTRDGEPSTGDDEVSEVAPFVIPVFRKSDSEHPFDEEHRNSEDALEDEKPAVKSETKPEGSEREPKASYNLTQLQQNLLSGHQMAQQQAQRFQMPAQMAQQMGMRQMQPRQVQPQQAQQRQSQRQPSPQQQGQRLQQTQQLRPSPQQTQNPRNGAYAQQMKGGMQQAQRPQGMQQPRSAQQPSRMDSGSFQPVNPAQAAMQQGQARPGGSQGSMPMQQPSQAALSAQAAQAAMTAQAAMATANALKASTQQPHQRMPQPSMQQQGQMSASQQRQVQGMPQPMREAQQGMKPSMSQGAVAQQAVSRQSVPQGRISQFQPNPSGMAMGSQGQRPPLQQSQLSASAKKASLSASPGGKPLLDADAIEESPMFDKPPVSIEEGMKKSTSGRKVRRRVMVILAIVIILIGGGIAAYMLLSEQGVVPRISIESSTVSITGGNATSDEGSSSSSSSTSSSSSSTSSGTGSGDLSGEVVYQYTANTASGVEYQVEETVTFGSNGDCLTSMMNMTFPDEASAKTFTDNLARDYGTSFKLDSLNGPNAVVTIDNSGLHLTRDQYENALRYSVTNLIVLKK